MSESDKLIILRSLLYYKNYLKDLLVKGDDALTYNETLDLIVKVENIIKGIN